MSDWHDGVYASYRDYGRSPALRISLEGLATERQARLTMRHGALEMRIIDQPAKGMAEAKRLCDEAYNKCRPADMEVGR